MYLLSLYKHCSCINVWKSIYFLTGLSSYTGCTFDDGPAACDYHQDLYDDFDWDHVSAQEPHYLPTEMPKGRQVQADPTI